MRDVRSLLAAFVALSVVAGASAHGGGGMLHEGFVSAISTLEPPVPGLIVRVLGAHDQLSVANLTQKVIVIGTADGTEITIRPGETGQWADPRIAPTGPPEREGLVRNWRIPGTADGQAFEIVGFLGYSGPLPDKGGLPAWALVLAGAAGAIVVAAALALPLRRRKGEGRAP
jgi:hypothetical protein